MLLLFTGHNGKYSLITVFLEEEGLNLLLRELFRNCSFLETEARTIVKMDSQSVRVTSELFELFKISYDIFVTVINPG